MAAGGGGWLRQGAVRATSHPKSNANNPFFLLSQDIDWLLEQKSVQEQLYIAGRRSVMGAGGN